MLKQNALRKDEPDLDRVFHALSDSTRRAVVVRLARGPATVSELARPLAMSLPAVVQHLQVLEQSGLVRSEKVGRVRTCRMEPAMLKTAEHWVAEQRALWEARFDRLDAYLKVLQDEENGDDSQK
jgi:DNA-binding transcriptional ArsR family regulator